MRMPNQSVDRTAHPRRARRPVTLDVEPTRCARRLNVAALFPAHGWAARSARPNHALEASSLRVTGPAYAGPAPLPA
jgi:hypothetical protein